MTYDEQKTQQISPNDLKGQNVKEIQEILYNGEYYDVTSFVKKHPGGSIIKFYTEQGEDATHAIQQFHQRSTPRVQNMLKQFKKRPADDKESIFDEETLKKNKALTEDFTKLYLELEKEGYFKPSISHNIYRIIETFIIGAIGFSFCFYDNYFIQALGVLLFGLAQGRTGWIQHEGGHHSLTGKPSVDRTIQTIMIGLGLGGSAKWWSRGHNKHHAMPQRLHRDVDLDTLPLLVYNKIVVKDPKQGKTFMIRYQKYLFVLIDTFLGATLWKVYLHPTFAMRHRNYLELASMGVHLLINLKLGLLKSVLATWIASLYLFGNFSLSHTHLPATSTPTHWVEYALTHTADVSGGGIVDWWMGYLNYQIEHHLFPTMPQFRQREIQPRVRALAKQHNLPYVEYSYFEAWKVTLDNLQKVADELNA